MPLEPPLIVTCEPTTIPCGADVIATAVVLELEDRVSELTVSVEDGMAAM